VTDNIEERKKLSFEQAEGIESLPSQLALQEVSPELRAALWHLVHRRLQQSSSVRVGRAYISGS
jgi:hypothetical protein